jgi:hypothetical protein
MKESDVKEGLEKLDKQMEEAGLKAKASASGDKK